MDTNGVLWELKSNIDDYEVNGVGCYGAIIILQPIFEKPTYLPNCWLVYIFNIQVVKFHKHI